MQCPQEKEQIMIYNALQRKLKFEQHEPTITGHELWCSATVSSSYSTTKYQRVPKNNISWKHNTKSKEKGIQTSKYQI